MIDGLADINRIGFDVRPIRYEEVLKELRKLRNNCSTGPDQIPVKMLKHVANNLALPLTNILNSAIEKRLFPTAWKLHANVLSPKGWIQVTSEQDIRPMTTFIEEETIMRSNIST